MKGKNNVVADALSRMPPTLSLMDISEDWKNLLLVEYSKNKFACEVLDGQVTDDSTEWWMMSSTTKTGFIWSQVHTSDRRSCRRLTTHHYQDIRGS